jgi:chemotaxis protein MotB
MPSLSVFPSARIMAKREPPPEEGAPLWMCTYGDLMSLLLCFFVMLFALSTIQPIKWEAIYKSMGGMGYTGTSKTKSNKSKPSTSLNNTPENGRRTAALSGGQPIKAPSEAGKVQSIQPAGDPVKGGLILFEMGSDTLTEQGKKDLQKMLSVLLSSPNKIMVKGHAAPNEVRGVQDIDLAYNRAWNVREYLISLGLKKEFFHISAVDATAIPDRAVLSAGSDPKLAGASVEVFLFQLPRIPE